MAKFDDLLSERPLSGDISEVPVAERLDNAGFEEGTASLLDALLLRARN